METSTKIILAVAVAVVLVYLYSTQKTHNRIESYNNQPLSGINYMRRSPVTYAFRGNGMDQNPHYLANPGDKLVPLEYGGFDFWSSSTPPLPAPVRMATELVNDTKLRMDMVESGDMGWFNYLHDRSVSNVLSPDQRPLEMASARVNFTQSSLYDGARLLGV